MSVLFFSMSRKHSNMELDLRQEILGAAPRAFDAFATHSHLLVSILPMVHQRTGLPQVGKLLTLISGLPLFKYVAIELSVIS